jgi:hypothetical protein
LLPALKDWLIPSGLRSPPGFLDESVSGFFAGLREPLGVTWQVAEPVIVR